MPRRSSGVLAHSSFRVDESRSAPLVERATGRHAEFVRKGVAGDGGTNFTREQGSPPRG